MLSLNFEVDAHCRASAVLPTRDAKAPRLPMLRTSTSQERHLLNRLVTYLTDKNMAVNPCYDTSASVVSEGTEPNKRARSHRARRNQGGKNTPPASSGQSSLCRYGFGIATSRCLFMSAVPMAFTYCINFAERSGRNKRHNMLPMTV